MRETRSRAKVLDKLEGDALLAVLALSKSEHDTGAHVSTITPYNDFQDIRDHAEGDPVNAQIAQAPIILQKAKRVTKPGAAKRKNQSRRVSARLAGTNSVTAGASESSDTPETTCGTDQIPSPVTATTTSVKYFKSPTEDVVTLTTEKVSPRKTRSRTRKNQVVSAAVLKPQEPGCGKRIDSSIKQTKSRNTLKLKLGNIPYKNLDYETLRGWTMRRPKLEKDYWPYPHHRGFKLGHNPWAHLNWPAPNVDQIRKVHKLLADHHQKYDFGSYVSMPAHATAGIVTIDAIFQTLFAQSTDNEIAIDTHSRLCNAFPYLVEGEKYVGKMPNWHEIRLLEREELQMAILQGGFHDMRAKYMKEILDVVYQKNVDRKAAGKQQYDHDANPPDAKDFVPGLLSMDWLTDDDDNSDEAVLGRLIQLSGIGIKSAMCVMAFSMKRPLFVVDVHVLRYAQWLGWVPKDTTNVDWVAMYLHKYIPDDIKYDLHNQIWTHCANENTKESKARAVICPFCGAKPPARSRDVSQFACPLADLLPPLEKRWGKAYTLQLRQEAREAVKEETAQIETDEDESAEDLAAETPKLKETSIAMFASGLPTPPSTPTDINMQITATIDVEESGGLQADDGPAQNKKKTKKLNLKAKSHRFEDITKDQAEELQAAGYYLWEFRPMDNTFMEEWGTFEKKPRYKWEKDTIMDKDVAVTWEYANHVLNHDGKHPWSRPSDQDIVTGEIMMAMDQ